MFYETPNQTDCDSCQDVRDLLDEVERLKGDLADVECRKRLLNADADLLAASRVASYLAGSLNISTDPKAFEVGGRIMDILNKAITKAEKQATTA